MSDVLSGKRYFVKQVLLAMDRKVLRGTLDEDQNGVYLLAACLPTEGLVLMEVEVKGKGSDEIPADSKVLKNIDLREKVVMGACLNNLVLGILIGKLKYRCLLLARRYFAAYPTLTLSLLIRL